MAAMAPSPESPPRCHCAARAVRYSSCSESSIHSISRDSDSSAIACNCSLSLPRPRNHPNYI